MNLTILKDEITNDPLGIGYAANLPNSPGVVVDMLNAKIFKAVKPRIVTARAIIVECPSGASILDKFEQAASTNSTIKWAVTFLGQEAGIDVGNVATQEMIDALTGPLLTAEEGAQLKNMALQPASRAEVLDLGFVSIYDLIAAGVY